MRAPLPDLLGVAVFGGELDGQGPADDAWLRDSTSESWTEVVPLFSD